MTEATETRPARTLTHADLSYRQQVRFWQTFKIDCRPHGCWEWQGTVDQHGYGYVRYERDLVANRFQTHRLAYLLMVGSIPDGLQLDHLCRNRVCGNPTHLEPVTCQENLLRSPLRAHRRQDVMECKQGHPYDEANTYIRPNGWRECRICRKLDQTRRTEQRRELAGATGSADPGRATTTEARP